MSDILTNDEKLSIVNQHLKNVEYSIYGLQLDIIEAEAVDNSEEAVAALSERLLPLQNKKTALLAEKTSLASSAPAPDVQ
jgi:hypothetical protein